MEDLSINGVRVLSLPATTTHDKTVKASGCKSAMVLFHGYGASAEDLAPLAGVVAPQCATFFPDGDLRVPTGPNSEGRAWFPIDMVALNEAMQSGQHRSFADHVPDGFDKAVTVTRPLLEALAKKYDRLIVGGFSQGAMLAAAHALACHVEFAGLVLLSGNLVDRGRFEATAMTSRQQSLLGRLKVFQSHGRRDPVLGLAGAEKLAEAFTHLGAEVAFESFDGGHEIPREVCLTLAKFIQRVA